MISLQSRIILTGARVCIEIGVFGVEDYGIEVVIASGMREEGEG